MSVVSVNVLTDPYLDVFTPVPRSEPDLCTICRRPRESDERRCWSCRRTAGRVTHPVELLVPISIYRSYSQLGRWLRRYKDPDSSVPPRLQADFTARIAAAFGRFLSWHGDCIREATAADWDVLVVVPSLHRPGAHPLQTALGRLRPELPIEELLHGGLGTIGRNSPADDGYQTTRSVSGRRVLLVDDTFTTGSHLQSAASTLTIAGAQVVAAIPIGRVIDTSWSFTNSEWWDRQRSLPFSFDTCCLE